MLHKFSITFASKAEAGSSLRFDRPWLHELFINKLSELPITLHEWGRWGIVRCIVDLNMLLGPGDGMHLQSELLGIELLPIVAFREDILPWLV